MALLESLKKLRLAIATDRRWTRVLDGLVIGLRFAAEHVGTADSVFYFDRCGTYISQAVLSSE